MRNILLLIAVFVTAVSCSVTEEAEKTFADIAGGRTFYTDKCNPMSFNADATVLTVSMGALGVNLMGLSLNLENIRLFILLLIIVAIALQWN